MPLEGQAQRSRRRGHGQIIVGGSQPSGGEDEIRPRERVEKHLLDAPGIVADGGPVIYADAQVRERGLNISEQED